MAGRRRAHRDDRVAGGRGAGHRHPAHRAAQHAGGQREARLGAGGHARPRHPTVRRRRARPRRRPRPPTADALDHADGHPDQLADVPPDQHGHLNAQPTRTEPAPADEVARTWNVTGGMVSAACTGQYPASSRHPARRLDRRVRLHRAATSSRSRCTATSRRPRVATRCVDGVPTPTVSTGRQRQARLRARRLTRGSLAVGTASGPERSRWSVRPPHRPGAPPWQHRPTCSPTPPGCARAHRAAPPPAPDPGDRARPSRDPGRRADRARRSRPRGHHRHGRVVGHRGAARWAAGAGGAAPGGHGRPARHRGLRRAGALRARGRDARLRARPAHDRAGRRGPAAARQARDVRRVGGRDVPARRGGAARREVHDRRGRARRRRRARGRRLRPARVLRPGAVRASSPHGPARSSQRWTPCTSACTGAAGTARRRTPPSTR